MSSATRIYVDFNKSGTIGIPLTTRGSQSSLERINVALIDGMELQVYQYDVDDKGRAGKLVATAAARFVEDHWEAELTSDVSFEPVNI